MTTHAAFDNLPVQSNQLLINGQTLQQLTLRAGQTPFYAYDRAMIRRRVAELRSALPDCIELHYAIKANPMPAVVQLMASEVDGLDVASIGELRTALDTTMDPQEISFAGPAKGDHELAAAIASGIMLNVESAGELTRIRRIAGEFGLQPRIALRVNPDFELKSSGMKMGGGAKPFGIDAEQMPALLDTLRDGPLQLCGLHIFSGSQNLRQAAIEEAQLQTFALAKRLSDAWGKPFELINLGGGLGIPYFPGEQALDLPAVGKHLQSLIDGNTHWLGQTRLVMELGRYLVGEAGYYVCRVIERKESRGQTYLMCDGGLHHHLANSGNFGQVLRKNYPVLIGNKAGLPSTETVTAQGPLCTPLDILADKVSLPEAAPGDWLVVLQSGAYGASASPASFLGHPTVVELLV
ncbi:pyridoxal-dependent decarboxylase, exosortase A system-associated [Pseudomonas profundi]|uniref:pyridoxal-dependent decarboxylase, exosortase A system-associated n=1 Tax=Pseudomonas profundi TaxID=1981513 RepID=UPI0012395999|nr:pyridoxal-dependent decarboxylase, exosortase A system-associated [Pseudomonas profundi]